MSRLRCVNLLQHGWRSQIIQGERSQDSIYVQCKSRQKYSKEGASRVTETLSEAVLTGRGTWEPSKYVNGLDLELGGGLPGVGTCGNSWSCCLSCVLYNL